MSDVAEALWCWGKRRHHALFCKSDFSFEFPFKGSKLERYWTSEGKTIPVFQTVVYGSPKGTSHGKSFTLHLYLHFSIVASQNCFIGSEIKRNFHLALFDSAIREKFCLWHSTVAKKSFNTYQNRSIMVQNSQRRFHRAFFGNINP